MQPPQPIFSARHAYITLWQDCSPLPSLVSCYSVATVKFYCQMLLSPATPNTAHGDSLRQLHTPGRLYHSFLTKVAAGRQLKLAEVRKVARGRVWTGQDALELGLVDKLGGLRDAIAAAKQRAGLPQVMDVQALSLLASSMSYISEIQPSWSVAVFNQ